MSESEQLLTEVLPDKVEIVVPELLTEITPKRKYKVEYVDDNSICSSCSC